jgi:DNA-directed RNA polymerase subunit RPC12/RpoP
MASEYDGFTVPQLKEMCRERNLPVSGTKNILLQRLSEADDTQQPPKSIHLNLEEENIPTSDKTNAKTSAPMTEVKCVQCGSKLRVPVGYEGMISCPSCSKKQDASGRKPSNAVPEYTREQKGLAFLVFGILIAIFALGLFFIQPFAAGCETTSQFPESDMAYQDCLGARYSTTSFASCCLILPFGFFIASFGYNLLQPQAQPTQLLTGAPNHPAEQVLIPPKSALVKAVEATAIGYGYGIAALLTMAVLFVAFLFILLMIVIFTY